MSINKLDQLRKYIFYIEIERIQFEQVLNRKGKFVEIGKTFSIKSKVYYAGINRSYDSSIEKNHKRYVAAILKRFLIAEVMSKPNDSKHRERILEQGKTIFNCLNN